MKGAAEARAQRDSYAQRIKQNEQRLESVTQRRNASEAKLQEVKNSKPQDVDDFEAQISALETQSEVSFKAIESTQSELERLAKSIDQARGSLNELENKKSEFNTEINMLESFLKGDSENFAPILNKVSPDHGFEKALSRALGDSSDGLAG
jgi:chromosome segregation ATPase